MIMGWKKRKKTKKINLLLWQHGVVGVILEKTFEVFLHQPATDGIYVWKRWARINLELQQQIAVLEQQLSGKWIHMTAI